MWGKFQRTMVMGSVSSWLAANPVIAQNSHLDQLVSSIESAQQREKRSEPTTLAELLSLPSDHIEKLDLALMNLLCAEGLQGSEDLNVQDSLNTLQQWTQRVKEETQRNYHRFLEHPEAYNRSEAEFRMGMLITVVQQDMSAHYNPERAEPQLRGERESDAVFYADSKDIYIHGLFSRHRAGTCASIPVLYVAIAQNLGYPAFLARAKGHFFVRYGEGAGHLNFEGTGLGYNVYPDEYYKKWPFPIEGDEIQTFGYLRPLSKLEALGDFLSNRAACLAGAKRFTEAAECWKWVKNYLPERPRLTAIIETTEKQAKVERDMKTWDALWEELDKEPLAYGPKAQFFNQWKLQTQQMMNSSTNLGAIRGAVDAFKASFRQYRSEISDNPALMEAPSEFSATTLKNTPSRPSCDPQSRRVYTIPRAKIPGDYFWNGVPPELHQRLQKLATEDEIIEEMHVYSVEEANLRIHQGQKTAATESIHARRSLIDYETTRPPVLIYVVDGSTEAIKPLKIQNLPLQTFRAESQNTP